MKKTLLKALSSTLALTLVATASIAVVGITPKEKIPAQEAPARQEAVVQAVKEDAKEATGLLTAIEAKAKETVKVETVKEAAPVTEKAKAAPTAQAETRKAAEEVAVPVIAKAAPATEAAEEVAAPAELEAEPEMVWDISATEFDSVTMAFYPVAAMTPMFRPDVEIYGNICLDHATGTVIISGDGAMEDEVYRHFMTVEKYLEAIEDLFTTYYECPVRFEYDENITNVIDLDMSIRCFSAETGEELFVTEEIRQMIDPTAFLEFSPERIIIEEGVTNVSDYAFVCCGDLSEVYLPSTIESIGDCAFEHCDMLTTIVIPENAKIDEDAFVYCDNLAIIQLVNDVYYLNGGIAVADADGEITCVRNLSEEEVQAFVNRWSPAPEEAPVVENPIIIVVTDSSRDHEGGAN